MRGRGGPRLCRAALRGGVATGRKSEKREKSLTEDIKEACVFVKTNTASDRDLPRARVGNGVIQPGPRVAVRCQAAVVVVMVVAAPGAGAAVAIAQEVSPLLDQVLCPPRQ